MSSKIAKLKEVEFNEIVTLMVIESDEDLSTIFKDEIKTPFSVLYTHARVNALTGETYQLIRDLFDKVILTKTSLIEKYEQLKDKLEVAPIQLPPLKTKKEKVVSTPSLPRRYGKDKIIKDIDTQNGKPTNAQLTGLAINDLKNTYIKLNSRIINDMLTDEPIFTDEDYRVIRSTITLLTNKLRNLLKKK